MVSKLSQFSKEDLDIKIAIFRELSDSELFSYYDMVIRNFRKIAPRDFTSEQFAEENAFFHVIAERGRKLLGLERGYAKPNLKSGKTSWVVKTDKQREFLENVGNEISVHMGGLIYKTAEKFTGQTKAANSTYDMDEAQADVFACFLQSFFDYDGYKGRLYNHLVFWSKNLKNQVLEYATQKRMYTSFVEARIAPYIEELKLQGEVNPTVSQIKRAVDRGYTKKAVAEFEAQGKEYTLEDIEAYIEKHAPSEKVIKGIKDMTFSVSSNDFNEEWESLPAYEGMSTTELTPERALEQKETQDVLADAMAKLSDPERIALGLKYGLDTVEESSVFNKLMDPLTIGCVTAFVDAMADDGYKVETVAFGETPYNRSKFEDHELQFMSEDRYVKSSSVKNILASAETKLASTSSLAEHVARKKKPEVSRRGFESLNRIDSLDKLLEEAELIEDEFIFDDAF